MKSQAWDAAKCIGPSALGLRFAEALLLRMTRSLVERVGAGTPHEWVASYIQVIADLIKQ